MNLREKSELDQRIAEDVRVYGNAYVVGGNILDPLEIQCLLSGYRDEAKTVPIITAYRYRLSGGSTIVFPASDVMHVTSGPADRDSIVETITNRFSSETEELRKTISVLARDERIFIPGSWKCPKCGFELQRTRINASTGDFGTTAADREDSEPCPNDGETLVRVTWEERCQQLGDRCTAEIHDRCTALDLMGKGYGCDLVASVEKLLDDQASLSSDLSRRASYVEDQRKTVIRLLDINNQEESIVGACNNRMQEVIGLRGEVERADRLLKWVKKRAQDTGDVQLFDAIEESDHLVDGETAFLEWCEKHNWFWSMFLQDDGSILVDLLSKTGPRKTLTVYGSTPNEARCRAVEAASK